MDFYSRGISILVFTALWHLESATDRSGRIIVRAARRGSSLGRLWTRSCGTACCTCRMTDAWTADLARARTRSDRGCRSARWSRSRIDDSARLFLIATIFKHCIF